MADSECTSASAERPAPGPVAIEGVIEGTGSVYEAALELSTLLNVFVQLEPMPLWAFSLHRMAERVTSLADVACARALGLRSGASWSALAAGMPAEALNDS